MANKKEMFSHPLRLRDLQNTPKILLPDISGNSLLFLTKVVSIHFITFTTSQEKIFTN